ncbi:hypothetical protein HMPREF1403_01355 [Helicobacter pylori GAM201Ai]|nr:hypothetical protein HMPREF1403_01355 [Helicobacter pylori GAM201Ai]
MIFRFYDQRSIKTANLYPLFLKIMNPFLIFQRLVCVRLLVSSIVCKDCDFIFAE